MASNAPKKQYGQNFLTTPDIPQKIVRMADIGKDTFILEIGPGKGILTKELAKQAFAVTAVEIDTSLRDTLERELAPFPNANVVYGDIMKTNIDKLIAMFSQGKKALVAANIPYYITSPLIMKLLYETNTVSGAVLMVQKEVAQRLTAVPGTPDYGAFTIAVQKKAKAEKLFTVKRGCFFPVPKVDSAVVKFSFYDEPLYCTKNEKLFNALVAASFMQRRKTLLNAVSSVADKSTVTKILKECALSPDIRGEALSITQFCKIADLLDAETTA